MVSESVMESAGQFSVDVSDHSGNKNNFHQKGNKQKLHRYIFENIIRDNNCVSIKTLTEVDGFDGNDKQKRYYVKKFIKASVEVKRNPN